MSGFQALEPQPTAEVILHTTAGDLRLELFAKQTPQTSRNFLQLCLDGYYDNTIFHRLVPSFILQGGDPTGTGSGGESSYGEPFEDEFHSRLKFNRRGLLGMANSGTKNDNGSQFFLTLGDTPELNGKNTMFGRISAEGDTIYNLMKMAEADVVDGTERPMYPSKVTGAEISFSPFHDMVKRVVEAPRTLLDDDKDRAKRKPKRKAGKNVLSFGGDDEEGESTPVVKKPKYNPALVNTAKEETAKAKITPKPLAEDIPKKVEPPTVTDRKPPVSPVPAVKNVELPSRSARSPSPSDSSDDEEDDQAKQSRAFVDRTNDEIARLKASMKRTVTAAPTEQKPKTGLEAFIPASSTRGRKRHPGGQAKEDASAFDLFNAFRAKLDAAPADSQSSLRDPRHTNGDPDGDGTNGKHSSEQVVHSADDEAALCDLHFIANCQSCTKWDEQGANEDDDIGTGWMGHALSFARDRLGKDLEWKRKNEEELVVIDPREKARDLKDERRREKAKAGPKR